MVRQKFIPKRRGTLYKRKIRLKHPKKVTVKGKTFLVRYKKVGLSRHSRSKTGHRKVQKGGNIITDAFNKVINPVIGGIAQGIGGVLGSVLS